MENIPLLILFWWIKCLCFSDRFTIYLVRSASLCVCVCQCVRESDVCVEGEKGYSRNEWLYDWVFEQACASVHLCVGIPHKGWTHTAASMLCKQAHHASPCSLPCFLLKETGCRSHICLWLKRVLNFVGGAHWEKEKNRKGIKKCSFGPADLLLDFNWVVKSNPELFQECQNVIPWLVYRRSPAVKDTDR